ncbi:hypothetical protein F4802DRAFT_382161 [Xylaria palmicola]|nr:hypothetical protein F4802DRAFT_382161 [Xylaria palmicola]
MLASTSRESVDPAQTQPSTHHPPSTQTRRQRPEPEPAHGFSILSKPLLICASFPVLPIISPASPLPFLFLPLPPSYSLLPLAHSLCALCLLSAASPVNLACHQQRNITRHLHLRATPTVLVLPQPDIASYPNSTASASPYSFSPALHQTSDRRTRTNISPKPQRRQGHVLL